MPKLAARLEIVVPLEEADVHAAESKQGDHPEHLIVD